MKERKKKSPHAPSGGCSAACLPALLYILYVCLCVLLCAGVCVSHAKAVLMHCQVSKVFQSRSFKFMLHTFVRHFNCPLTFKFMPSTSRIQAQKGGGGGW